MFFIANHCHNNVSVWIGKKCNSGLQLWTLLFYKTSVPFAQRSTRSLGATLREIWDSYFIWRGPLSLRRFPVTSRENPFDVKVRSKPTDSVFIWTTWFRVPAKGGNCNHRSKKSKKKGEESAWKPLWFTPQVGLYPECLFPTFEGSGLLHTFFCTHSSGMFGVYPAFFDFPSRSFLSYHLTQMKCDSLSLAGCRSSPTYFSPPSRWLKVCSSGDNSSCFWRDVPLMHARRAWRSGQLFASSPCLSSRSVKHANLYLCACVHACPHTPD